MNRSQCVQFGIAWESELMPLCAQALGEDLVKTAYEYDCMDFQGKDCWCELKVRSKQYHPLQFKTWLLPYCKLQRAKSEDKQVFFFYYWTATKQLFVIEYEEAKFSSFRVDVPEWKQDKQLQVFVPSECWDEILIE